MASSDKLDARDRSDLPIPPDQTPWQRIYHRTVGSLSEGAVIEEAVAFRRIAEQLSRHNH